MNKWDTIWRGGIAWILISKIQESILAIQPETNVSNLIDTFVLGWIAKIDSWMFEIRIQAVSSLQILSHLFSSPRICRQAWA